jgi:hypothetical protein
VVSKSRLRLSLEPRSNEVPKRFPPPPKGGAQDIEDFQRRYAAMNALFKPRQRIEAMAEELRTPDLTRLIALLPRLEARDASCEEPFLEAFWRDEVVCRFHSRTWENKPEKLGKGNLVDCRKALTRIVARDHFSLGSLGYAINSGEVAQIVRRMAELHEQKPKKNAPPKMNTDQPKRKGGRL